MVKQCHTFAPRRSISELRRAGTCASFIYDAFMLHPPFILRCLDLASQGRHKVGNGAMVGACLVRSGMIIAEAYHRGFGMPHAERELLENFKGPIEPQDVLYVNLEPCCHRGKTPPCTDIIIDRGIKTVVYGMRDPDPRVSGKGFEALRAAGIEVLGPIERALCERFNKGFISVRTRQRPYITLKMAQDRAESISNADGSPKKITSQKQDIWSHTFLRGSHDAILVGVGTVISDNPILNIRFDQKFSFSYVLGLNGILNKSNNSIQPYRIILDPRLRIPLTVHVVSEHASRTIICTTPESAKSEKTQELLSRAVRILRIPMKNDHFEWSALRKALMTPEGDFHGITSILVEGGGKTWKAFRNAGVVDEEVTLIGSL